jgi:hypothetical protein
MEWYIIGMFAYTGLGCLTMVAFWYFTYRNKSGKW